MTNYQHFTEELRAAGMNAKAAVFLVNKLKEDEEYSVTTPEEKEWALMRGFFPGRIAFYGLTEENYRDYVPDYHYFMLFPFNHHFRIWINDKLTLKYVLNRQDLKQFMPEYYLYIENDGSYTYLMDCPDEVPKDEHFIRNLLCRKKKLVMKPNSGTSGGLGFLRLEQKEDLLYVNNRLTDEAEFAGICYSLKNYIVTEYVTQHEALADIWPKSECTLRVIMYKNVKDRYEPAAWSCAASYARFGTEISGGVSNISAGGFGVVFDFDTGLFAERGFRYRRFSPDGSWQMWEHPDSHKGWYGSRMPRWEETREAICRICGYISSLSYLAFDIIITSDGMKICEINSLPSMDYEQVMCGPALGKEPFKRFFMEKGLTSFDGKRFYEAYMNSQE